MNAGDQLSSYNLTFPIYIAEEIQVEGAAGICITGETMGTAFALSHDRMMTAGHVAREISSTNAPYFGVVGIASPDHSRLKSARVRDWEILPGDIGILRVEHLSMVSTSWVAIPQWRQQSLNTFDQVRTLGFPYGTHRVDDKQSTVQRAFQGHIVTRLNEFKPIGWTEAAFPAYELSFAAPRGLSGAPLMNSAGTVHICGMVIGNSESKMLVYRTEERLSEPSQLSVVEHYESLHLGVAVPADFMLSLRSQILNGSVADFLRTQNRLA